MICQGESGIKILDRPVNYYLLIKERLSSAFTLQTVFTLCSPIHSCIVLSMYPYVFSYMYLG